MGRLVGLNRFCLLTDDGIHYSEGILYAGHTEKIFDPSLTTSPLHKKEIKALSANPDKRPWLEILSRLNYFTKSKDEFNCLQTYYAHTKLRVLQRRHLSKPDDFAVWSGGLAVGNNAGEQFVTGNNDYVESVFWFQAAKLPDIWFPAFQQELQALEQQVKTLYASVLAYFKLFGVNRSMDQPGIKEKRGTDMAKLAETTAFALLEKQIYPLPYLDTPAKRKALRRRFAATMMQVFNQFCPNQTPRQMEAWAAHIPNLTDIFNRTIAPMNPIITEVAPLQSDDTSNNFVRYLIEQCQSDRNLAARLRRSLTPAFEYLSWDVFALFGIALEKPSERLPHALIAYSIAQLEVQNNGPFALGQAIALTFTDGPNREVAQMRLRRLLACTTLEEVLPVLRNLVANLHPQHPLDYVALLNELLEFSSDPHAIKARWAQQFYTNEAYVRDEDTP